MELVLIVTAAGLIGTALRYTLPGRDRHGLALMPASGVIIGSLIWAIAIWVGLDAATPWPWLLSLGLTLVGVTALGIWLPRARDAADQARWSELTRP